MSTTSKVEDYLQKALAMELAAVHQYLLHAHVLEDWGLGKLAAKMRAEMQEELGHADAYAGRLVYLKATPEMKAAKVPVRAQRLEDLFGADLRDEEEAIRFYTEAARAADAAGDIGSRDLFEQTVLDEEGHKRWLSTQLGLLKRLGEPAFVAMYVDIDAGEGGAS